MMGQIHVVTPQTRAHENVNIINSAAGRAAVDEEIKEIKTRLQITETTTFVAFIVLPSKMNKPGFELNDPY